MAREQRGKKTGKRVGSTKEVQREVEDEVVKLPYPQLLFYTDTSSSPVIQTVLLLASGCAGL